jgi:hypothetical protein
MRVNVRGLRGYTGLVPAVAIRAGVRIRRVWVIRLGDKENEG